MRLSNTLWQKRNKIVIILLSSIAIISALPLIRTGLKGVFYNMDPEMALVGNSLSYIKYKIIGYRDHPGTPSIYFIYLSYIPLRIYTKYFEHTNFIVWSFDNLRFLFLYTRYLFVGLFSMSIFVFLQAINKITRQTFILLYAIMSLILFGFTQRLAGTLLTEGLTFFLISAWLLYFSTKLKSISYKNTLVLSFLGGLAVSNKYNSFPIMLTSILLPFMFKLKISENIKKVFIAGLTGIFGFVIGTWPIRDSYEITLGQIFKVFLQSGNAHVDGETNFFNLKIYLTNIQTFYNVERTTSLIIFFTIVFILIFTIFRNKIKIRIDKPIYVLFFATFGSLLFIFKYPATYYHFPNVILFVYLSCYLINKIKPIFVIFFVLLLFLPFMKQLNGYNQNFINNIEDSIIVENYIINNVTEKPTLWDYGPTGDFMQMWLRGWGSGIYSEQLKEKRPDLLELKSDYKTVFFDNEKYTDVFNACWDKLYIRDYRAQIFLDMYNDRKFIATPIGKTGIWEIKSTHCTSKP